MIHALGSCSHDADSGTFRLNIENASDQGVRCVAMLAHFVTVDLPVIPAGSTYDLILERDGTGGLAFGDHEGEPMMLENLLCGTDTAWSASVQDLPLLALRTGRRSSWSLRCESDTGRLACGP